MVHPAELKAIRMSQETRPIQILRFNTCGSVDDGKSTLIGRLLFDSRALRHDQLCTLAQSADITGGWVNLANITDGLRAERRQGITIDVGYRYFASARRRFIIADTPGHEQYTRNMVTGASGANLSVVLVDACKGVTEQTRRHLYISALLGIKHVVVAINKMDLAGWSEERFLEIRQQFESFLPRLNGLRDVTFIPISALHGDNVVQRSRNMRWYDGPTLLGHLESVHVTSDFNLSTLRFPVQWVNRAYSPLDPKLHAFRGYAGQLAGGIVRLGQKVLVLPVGLWANVAGIVTFDGALAEAFCPQSITLILDRELDIGRGDMIVDAENLPGLSSELRAKVCWFSTQPLRRGGTYWLKHTTRIVQTTTTDIESRINIGTFEPEPGADALKLNDVGQVRLKTAEPIVFDGYQINKFTGAFILIEQGTNATVGAGMLLPPTETVKPEYHDYAI